MVIYITTNLINGKKYIGKDEKNNSDYLGSGIHLTRSIKKYGKENFRKEIIEHCKTSEELKEKEIYWIDFYKACESDQFYNIAKGGDGGNVIKGYSEEQKKEIYKKTIKNRKWYKPTDETKQKISQKHKGKKLSDITKFKLSEYNKGKKWTSKQRENFIKSNTGHIVTEETRLKISKATKGKHTGLTPWNKGIPMTDETKEKLSILRKGKNCGNDNSSYNKIWLNDGNKNLYVLKKEIDNYINDGYKMGMIKKYNNTIRGYLKYRPDGLYAIIFNKSQSIKLDEILLTKDVNKMFSFLGLDANRKYEGFETLEEIYDWIISCKYFKPQIFFLENLNQDDRKRNKKRPTFNKFLEYIKNFDFDNELTNNISVDLIDQSFPEVHFMEQIERLRKKGEEIRELKEKFNGQFVMEWTGLKDKELGETIKKFRDSHSDEWIRNHTSDEIKENFLNWFGVAGTDKNNKI